MIAKYAQKQDHIRTLILAGAPFSTIQAESFAETSVRPPLGAFRKFSHFVSYLCLGVDSQAVLGRKIPARTSSTIVVQVLHGENQIPDLGAAKCEK